MEEPARVVCVNCGVQMVARCFKRHSSNSCHPRQSFVPLVLDAAGAEVLSLFPLSLCLLKEVSPIVRELHRAQGIFERVSFLSRCSLLSASWSGRRLLAFKPFLRGIRILVRPFPFPSLACILTCNCTDFRQSHDGNYADGCMGIFWKSN